MNSRRKYKTLVRIHQDSYIMIAIVDDSHYSSLGSKKHHHHSTSSIVGQRYCEHETFCITPIYILDVSGGCDYSLIAH